MITIKVTKETLSIIENKYKDYITNRNIGYILFVIKTPDNIITAYDNKSQKNFKVTIQGENTMELAKEYAISPDLLPKKHKEDKESLYYIDVEQQIGSDEVGTGDFFGPVVVCAAYCDLPTMKIVEQYGINDSKKLTDKKILQIVPLILKKVHYYCKVIKNRNYNQAISRGFNMNKIKALGHNFALLNLHERCPYVKNVYVDQFTPEDKYYEYLEGCSNVQDGIIFKEKGETYFPSVALASCIARYYFIQEMHEIGDKYNVTIPFGAGIEVNNFAKRFVKKFGVEELNKICKQNFKNYQEVIADQLTLF